jgi:hypothetical protein
MTANSSIEYREGNAADVLAVIDRAQTHGYSAAAIIRELVHNLPREQYNAAVEKFLRILEQDWTACVNNGIASKMVLNWVANNDEQMKRRFVRLYLDKHYEKPARPSQVFVAVEGKEIVAFSVYADAKGGIVEHLYEFVVPTLRGKGVFRALDGALANHLVLKHGCTLFTSNVPASNTALVASMIKGGAVPWIRGRTDESREPTASPVIQLMRSPLALLDSAKVSEEQLLEVRNQVSKIQGWRVLLGRASPLKYNFAQPAEFAAALQQEMAATVSDAAYQVVHRQYLAYIETLLALVQNNEVFEFALQQGTQRLQTDSSFSVSVGLSESRPVVTLGCMLAVAANDNVFVRRAMDTLPASLSNYLDCLTVMYAMLELCGHDFSLSYPDAKVPVPSSAFTVLFIRDNQSLA